jgi:hypothetical protein
MDDGISASPETNSAQIKNDGNQARATYQPGLALLHAGRCLRFPLPHILLYLLAFAEEQVL